jgi:hypothetical protein
MTFTACQRNGEKVPQIIKHIDAIARQKGRDVLFVAFPECYSVGDKYVSPDDCKTRRRVIAWLDQAGIGWCPCAHAAGDDGALLIGYLGHIYIDLPYDTADPEYQKLADFLETPDGKMKIEGVEFYCCPLEIAMKNRHHDEPGYWEEQMKDW